MSRLLSVFTRHQGCAGARVPAPDDMRWMAADEAAEVMDWTHQPAWLPADVRTIWMDRCVQKIVWDQPEVRVYGRWHLVPRLTAFLADHRVSYRYSGAVHRGQGWPEWFLSLSLGSSRDLQFRHRLSGARCDLTLEDGDLLLMDPDCQKLWMHGLPVRKRVKAPRLNLTFRVFRSVD